MIYRNIKEALNLVGMEVHGDETVDTGNAEQVGYQFSTDADTWFVLTILTGPSEVRNNSDDVAGRCTLAASIIRSNSIKLSELGNVLCARKTSRPRIDSSKDTPNSPSENLVTTKLPSGQPKLAQIFLQGISS